MNLPRKGVTADRNMAALKNHSEAERRRRARINAHFDTLRDLVPGAKKMDKASLLAEVIGYLRELKKNAEKACEGVLVPMDTDEVRVEKHEDGMDGNHCLIRASLCCDYKPGLLSDLRRALDALHLIIVKAEMTTWEGRMKNVFVVASCKEWDSKDAAWICTSTLDKTLRSVLDKFSASEEFSFRATLSNKRRRLSLFDSSLSSSSAYLCHPQMLLGNRTMTKCADNLILFLLPVVLLLGMCNSCFYANLEMLGLCESYVILHYSLVLKLVHEKRGC